jgi:hypothetical protein
MKPISRVGKGALFAPCPRGYDDGGHASLCPPYKSDGIDFGNGVLVRDVGPATGNHADPGARAESIRGSTKQSMIR